MLVFDRSQVAEPAPKKAFRLYWEISGPLTAAVILFSLYWLFWPSSVGVRQGMRTFNDKFRQKLDDSDNLTGHEAMDHTAVGKHTKRKFQIRSLLKADTYQINTLSR